MQGRGVCIDFKPVGMLLLRVHVPVYRKGGVMPDCSFGLDSISDLENVDDGSWQGAEMLKEEQWPLCLSLSELVVSV